MLARLGTSWGASSWCRPWREMKAMGIGLGREEEGWWRTEMGEEGAPQGVSSLRVATWEKPPMDWRPVPPITAMWMGSSVGSALGVYVRRDVRYRHSYLRCSPSSETQRAPFWNSV